MEEVYQWLKEDKQMRFTADFETTTDPADCRVWAFAVCSIDDQLQFQYGTTLDEFMEFCRLVGMMEDTSIYFHNLKFDGEFIFSWLYRKGFSYVKTSKELVNKSFTTLIDRHKNFYSIEVCFKKRGKSKQSVKFYDSLKILPFSVESIAKGFNLPIRKLEIDYKAKRPVDHKLTPLEIDYIKNDVQITAMALKVLFDEGMKSMTAGANALLNYKLTIGFKNFLKWFPVPDYQLDQYIRRSYKGGFTYVQEGKAGIEHGPGLVFDVNSLYPSVMRNQLLPYGEPKYFQGQYIQDEAYHLHIQKIRCQFELKPGHIPTVQLKNNPRFIGNEYLKDSGNIEEVITMTSVDLKLFLDHYEVFNLEYIDGFKFKATTGLFTDYIDRWSEIKIKAKLEKNSAMYTLAKLMLNSLYGKFSTSPDVQSSFPVADLAGIINYVLHEEETREPVYIPVGTFITAWARYKTITAAQSMYDRFLYADTDSLHISGLDIPPQLEVSDTDLGAWKLESIFQRGKYLRQKCYVEYGREPGKNQDEFKVTVAGMPSSIHKHVSFENFDFQTSFIPDTLKNRKKYKGQNVIFIPTEDSKLKPLHVPGGIVLTEIDFTLKK